MSLGLSPETIELLWQKVLAAALLGTDRQPFALPQAEGALGDLFSRLDLSDPEGALLSAAAMLSYMRRVGKLPVTPIGRALPPPCPPDPQAAASRQAAMLLREFDVRRPRLLKEWLRLAFERGVRAPEECLPELLTLSESVEPVMGALVAGVRGRWLAAQIGGKWTYAAFQLEDDSAWQTGAPITRQTYLGALRLIDPERARRLLEETWERESPECGAALLEMLVYNLSETDLPFLSRVAQTDRTLSIREIATDFIHRLTQPAPSPEKREASVMPLFSLSRLWAPGEIALLISCEHDWSAGFSQRFAEYLPLLLAGQIMPNASLWRDSSFPTHFEPLLARLHPRAIAAAVESLSLVKPKGVVLRHIAEWQAILQFRAALHAAF
ncbi:MAG: hypothetical protein CUN51_06800 [Candidatus Thermofonsia Clade 1 bacterium]|uniref:Uncharacterized protein n=1 Tax=Candidatus Thermofonsia Clade 1 bacterium TaxID=2364210 RepID=A0A2M8NZF7_9CHLR|nr:MAG: hypothetical protein CUN51_06800 [Candidatus Thermofonsia Clade 1 bacterium]